jgi:hypothetical protein
MAPVYNIYLMGDAGRQPEQGMTPALRLMARDLEGAPPNTAVVFLGDNSYPDGLPPAEHPQRAEARQNVTAQLKAVEGVPGPVVFIPGNHDWQSSGAEGHRWVQAQERFIEAAFDAGNHFLPDNGCPGPVAQPLGEEWLLLALDTQWWTHPYPAKRPHGSANACDQPATAAAVTARLRKLLQQHRDRKVLVVGHHPLYSNGAHGGRYTLAEHLFPLRLLHENLWVPLPVLGSIYPTARKLADHNTDLTNPRYRRMKDSLLSAFEAHPHVVYAAGHEHALQYFRQGGDHFIVSGSGSKRSPVRKGLGADFAYSWNGYAVLSAYRSGEVWLRFYSPAKGAPAEKEMVFKTRLYRAGAEARRPGGE